MTEFLGDCPRAGEKWPIRLTDFGNKVYDKLSVYMNWNEEWTYEQLYFLLIQINITSIIN